MNKLKSRPVLTRRVLSVFIFCTIAINLSLFSAETNQKQTYLDQISLEQTRKKAKAAFNYIADNIEALVTKKGIVKASTIIIPICLIYSYFFSSTLVSFGPVEELLQKITSSISINAFKVAEMVGQVHGTYEYGVSVGKYEAFLSSFWQYPGETIKYFSTKFGSTLITGGVPFVAGLLLKSCFKVS